MVSVRRRAAFCDRFVPKNPSRRRQDAQVMHSPLANKKVLVTGGSGFLGSHVVEAVRARGAAEVLVPRAAECDLTEPAPTRSLLEASRPDVILHLAARVGGIGAN